MDLLDISPPTLTLVPEDSLQEVVGERYTSVVLDFMRYVLDATGPEAIAGRAAMALARLPGVAGADVVEGPRSRFDDFEIMLEPASAQRRIRVRLSDPDDRTLRAHVTTLVGLVSSVHRREAELRRLSDQAHTDSLTGLCNRRGFQPFVDQALARACRAGESVALILCDIDHFKTINDQCGHKRGDMALRTVAEAMRKVIRPTDLAARLGGDEMAILLSGANASGAAKVAERLRREVQRTNPLRTHSLTLSIGIADDEVLPAGPLVAWQARDSVFRAADEALYTSKQQGRDQVVCHPSCFLVDEIDVDVTRPISLAI